jgi:hypothetical protein
MLPFHAYSAPTRAHVHAVLCGLLTLPLLVFAAQVASAQQCGDCNSCCCPAGDGSGCTDAAAGNGSMLECPSSWGCCSTGPGSPIIVDTTGRGFHLTSGPDGVWFDIRGDGHPILISWTAAGSGNAFLALDRNHNGKIDNGKELFGNFTAQPESLHPNGYLALAEFDKPENGGNGDGIIDSRDAVFSHLLLWIDENHNGISEPNELHTLPELGVYSIALRYRDDQHFFDQYGNWFHYQSALNPDPHDGTSKDGRLTYDVFFVAGGQRFDFNAEERKLGFSLRDKIRPLNDAPRPSTAGAVDAPEVLKPTDLRGETSSIIANDVQAGGPRRLPLEVSTGDSTNTPSSVAQRWGSTTVLTSAPPLPGSNADTAAKMRISNPLEAEGLRTIAFDSAEFLPTLETMIDADMIARAEPFLQYSVILVNATGRYIWGFTAVYTYPDKIAPSGSPWRHQINPSVGGVGNRAQYLAPGARYLLTPVSNFLAEVDADGRRGIRPSWYDGIEQVMKSQSGIGDPLRRRVELSIDSLIYEDGILVGPDRADRLDEVNRRILREKRFADSLTGLAGSALRDRLEEYASYTGADADARANAWRAKDLKLRYSDPSLGEGHVRGLIEGMGAAQWFLGSQKVRRKE